MSVVHDVLLQVEAVEQATDPLAKSLAKAALAMRVASAVGETQNDVQAALDAMRPMPPTQLRVGAGKRAARLPKVTAPDLSLEATVAAVAKAIGDDDADR